MLVFLRAEFLAMPRHTPFSLLQVIVSLLFYERREQLSHGLICMYAHFDNLILYSNIFRHRSRQRPMFCWHRQPSCLYHHIHNQHRPHPSPLIRLQPSCIYHHIHNQPCPHPSAVFPLQPSCRSCLPLTLCHYSQHSTTRLFVFSFCFTSWSPWYRRELLCCGGNTGRKASKKGEFE